MRFLGSSFFNPERKRRSGQLLCFNFLMKWNRRATFKMVRLQTVGYRQFRLFGFANFFWPYLLTRVLVLGDSNCYVFLLKSYITVGKFFMPWLLYFGRGSQYKSLVSLFVL